MLARPILTVARRTHIGVARPEPEQQMQVRLGHGRQQFPKQHHHLAHNIVQQANNELFKAKCTVIVLKVFALFGNLCQIDNVASVLLDRVSIHSTDKYTHKLAPKSTSEPQSTIKHKGPPSHEPSPHAPPALTTCVSASRPL